MLTLKSGAVWTSLLESIHGIYINTQTTQTYTGIHTPILSHTDTHTDTHTHTHTHTYIYIYIYIFGEMVDFGESDKMIKISGKMD